MPNSTASPRYQDELDEEDVDQLSAVDRDFVMNTKDLFEDVDAELLSEDFVPHEHVVGIIVSETTGGEASLHEIDDNLMDYKDLEAEINADLADYIDAHHQEFNNAIYDFSEMVLAVSGSDDTLAQFKKELADAVGSLESHAGELKVLRLRAAKSLFMVDAFKHIQEVVLAETEVKGLIQNRHYLAAVQKLQTQARLLASDEMRGVRAVQTLRDTHNATVSTLHHLIIDDLLACVFRHERLVEADAQLLQALLDSSERDTKDTHVAAPSVQDAIYTYWKGANIGTSGNDGTVEEEDSAGETHREGDGGGGGGGASTHGGTTADSATAAGAGRPVRKEHTLAAIIETLTDDPTEDHVFSNYLKFVPLSIKSLMMLGKIDRCHETFFSRATRNIERFIAHFISLYDAWRRRTRNGVSLSNDEAEAAIRGTYVRALDLANDLISFDEAVATIQGRDLHSMLGALFTELEKVLRNAAYLQKVVLVAHFPFVSSFVVQPVPFSPEATSSQWNVVDVPLRSATWLRDTLTTALDYAQNSLPKVPATRDESSSNSLHASGGDQDADDVMTNFLRFFNVDAVLAPLKTEAVEKDAAPAAAAAAAPLKLKRSGSVESVAASDSSPFLSFDQCKPFLTLRGICDLVDSACAQTLATYPSTPKAVLRKLQLTLTAELRDAVRVKLVAEVQGMLQEWDLQVLWSQLNYHIELFFHAICDAKEAQDETDDAVTLLPFLRQKNLISRVQRTANILQDSDKQGDDASTLERLLSTFESGGVLRMMEETGTVSFSLVGAVKKAQADLRKVSEGQARQLEAMQSDTAKFMALADSGQGGGGVSGTRAPLVLLHANMLRRWFVFTAMNALTCYVCAARFYSRCCDRVPEFRLLSEESCIVGFFKRFLRATYIPTLHAFHSQQLQLLLMSIGDNAGNSAAGAAPSASTPLAGTDPTAQRSGKAPTAMNTLNGAWPAVVVDEVQYPILACVQYVGQVLAKVNNVRDILPKSLTEEVEQNTSEALIMELVVFLKRQVQWLGRGTLAHRLLNRPFADAFAGMPNRKWAALVDEQNIMEAHKYIDQDLYRYYQFNSNERTSGHEYNSTVSLLEAMRMLETSFAVSPGGGGGADDAEAELDRQIGRMEPRDICVHDDSTLVAFALLCTSAEWLCDLLLRYLWPNRRTAHNYTDCCVPGYCFTQEMRISTATSSEFIDSDYAAQQKVRLSSHLVRLCSIAQVALFHLSVEARFLAFLFLPQLRDVSYDVVAVSSAADMFVQAYARRVHNFYAILRQHLHAKKIKYTCLTAGKPASELILMELAHLRNKAISQAGLMRLRTDLLVMQTTLQLILPTDTDVREAVPRLFLRPALFLRYIFNRDVVSEIVSSLDYLNFSTKEVEVLIRLVFRQVSGANDDTLAVQHIQWFYQKLKIIQNLRYSSTDAGSRGSIGKASPQPAAHDTSNGGVSGDAPSSLVPLSRNAAAVVAAALDGGDYYHNSAFSYDEGGSDASDSQPPPLPLLSATRGRQSALGGLAASPSISVPSTPVPAPLPASSAAAPVSTQPATTSEEDEEDEETPEVSTMQRSVRQPQQSPIIPGAVAARSFTSATAAAAAAGGAVAAALGSRSMLHAGPTSLQATPSPSSLSSAAAVKPALARPVVPPLATEPLRGASATAPTPSAKTGTVKVEEPSEDEDDEEYEYEEEETSEYEEDEEDEEDEEVPTSATSVKRPLHPPPHPAVAPNSRASMASGGPSASTAFARK
ncbi:putative Sec8 exocyst complex component specific domain containing protein [Leishmania utingensis]|uniref:Exocyst complex component Sec8 n=1 Tax=Leishmania utingensis TaxID=653362 RepID=A0AAW3AI72_9TRYP